MRIGLRVPGCLSPERVLPARRDKAHRGNGACANACDRAHRGDLPEGSRKTTALIGRVWKRGNTLS